MTKRECAIVSAYTGYFCGDFNELHKYVQEILERPVFIHELGNEEVAKEIHKKSKEDFIKLGA